MDFSFFDSIPNVLYERFESLSSYSMASEFVEVFEVGGEKPAPATPEIVAKDVGVDVNSPLS